MNFMQFVFDISEPFVFIVRVMRVLCHTLTLLYQIIYGITYYINIY